MSAERIPHILELTEQLEEAWQILESIEETPEGFDEGKLLEVMAQIEGDVHEQLDTIHAALRTHQAKRDAVDAEFKSMAKVYADRIRGHDSRIHRLQALLLAATERIADRLPKTPTGHVKFEGKRGRFRIQQSEKLRPKSPEMMRRDAEGLKFLVPQPPKVDLSAIRKQYLKADPEMDPFWLDRIPGDKSIVSY